MSKQWKFQIKIHYCRSVLVGAPRAQSTLETQQNINETGAIYRCTFEPAACLPYNYDELGNIEAEDTGDQFTRERKDHQWLGAVMDGSSSDDDRFIVSLKLAAS